MKYLMNPAQYEHRVGRVKLKADVMALAAAQCSAQHEEVKYLMVEVYLRVPYNIRGAFGMVNILTGCHFTL